DARRDLSLEQVRWELERAHERVLSAIASATERGLDDSRYGEAGLHSAHAREHAGWIRAWRAREGFQHPANADGLPDELPDDLVALLWVGLPHIHVVQREARLGGFLHRIDALAG